MFNQRKMEAGYLEIILGSMKSGKTSRLSEIYKQCKYCNIPVVAINHSDDKRFDTELMSTHDGIKTPCISTRFLMDIYIDFIDLDNYMNVDRIQHKMAIQMSDVILINEGQFFMDIELFVKKMLEKNKRVYVCGLDGDFERKKIGNILDLIPLCDKVTKLTSLCEKCKDGTPGIFSKRTSNETEQIVIGHDNYISICRKCYENKA